MSILLSHHHYASWYLHMYFVLMIYRHHDIMGSAMSLRPDQQKDFSNLSKHTENHSEGQKSSKIHLQCISACRQKKTPAGNTQLSWHVQRICITISVWNNSKYIEIRLCLRKISEDVQNVSHFFGKGSGARVARKCTPNRSRIPVVRLNYEAFSTTDIFKILSSKKSTLCVHPFDSMKLEKQILHVGHGDFMGFLGQKWKVYKMWLNIRAWRDGTRRTGWSCQ